MKALIFFGLFFALGVYVSGKIQINSQNEQKFLIYKLATPLFKNDWTIIKVRNKGGYVARFEVLYKLGNDYIRESTGTFPGY